MTDNTSDRIADLEKEISALPVGYISKKTINGKTRYYRQWTENGKIKSQYIRNDEYDEVSQAIGRRKELQKELKDLNKQQPQKDNMSTVPNYEMNVMTAEALKKGCALVSHLQRRDCFGQLRKYLSQGSYGKVCVVYGLRRTGKTTMLFQAMSDLPIDRTVYIKAQATDSMAMLNRDLKKLSAQGYKYIFLDEITLLEDFIDSAAVLSDIYAMQGIKIVMSGTDSLGFWFVEHEELYDRAYMIHTTFIPFREHARLLGIDDIDEYIRYGGTLRAGEVDFDDAELNVEEASFRDDESTRRYIDTAICKNIQHSLACCESGGHFRHLIDLYEAGELTNAINRIIESMNKSFLVSVIEKRFRSGDLGNARKNLRKETNPEKQSDALDHIDEEDVLRRMKAILDIKEPDELTVKITSAHMTEIKEYLRALDLIVDCPIRTDSSEEPVEHILFTQPGMRYCQAQALVHSLMKDPQFNGLSEREVRLVSERILDDVKGRMMEDIILLECVKVAKRNQNVFKLLFDRGEFDMVIYDSENDVCAIYEIKHSKAITPEQSRHLCDEEMCEKAEKRFGEIVSKTVIYRGKPTTTDQDIIYENAEDFLKGLPDSMNIDPGQGFTMQL